MSEQFVGAPKADELPLKGMMWHMDRYRSALRKIVAARPNSVSTMAQATAVDVLITQLDRDIRALWKVES